MDMKISGSGIVPSGEYEAIEISGSGHLQGTVKCTSLHVSGSVNAHKVECSGEICVSGACDIGSAIFTKSLHVSGAINSDSNVTATEEIHFSGGANIDGDLKCGTLDAHGGLNVGGDIEAETALVRGNLCCKGLLNAEQIDINTKSGCSIGSIGGSKIQITYTKRKLFQNLVTIHVNGERIRGVKVEQTIEGDEIDVKYVTCPRVSGRTVKVGEACEIELLQYSEKYEIHEKAKVGKIEKI